MLTRIISGAVGVLILAVVLFFHNTIVLPAAVALMIAGMLFELLRAVKLEKCLPVLIAAEFCGIAMPLIVHIEARASYALTLKLTKIMPFAITLAAAFAIFVTWLRHHNDIRYEQIFFALAVMILVPQAMTCTLRIELMDADKGLFWLIMGLCGAWIADTGAYFTGVAIGKHKLCPEISPKKTVEGFIGGLVTTGIVFAAAFGIHGGFTVTGVLITFLLGMVCAAIGTVGDLSASMVKRQIGFKDYGKIMPGHGGLMDRFDSVIFVVPTFYAFISISELVSGGKLF